MPIGWSNKIVDYEWKYGDSTTKNLTASEIYNIENNWTSITKSKIGLVYFHDYYYGLSGGNNCSNSETSSSCNTLWLHLSNNDLEAPWGSEIVLSRYGYYTYDHYYYVYIIGSDYVSDSGNLEGYFSIRPVFYLNAAETYISGNGTLNNPIIISDIN